MNHSTESIYVEVDGLGVEVDRNAYLQKPDIVEDEVRAARAALRLELDEEPPTYTELVGEDADL